MKYQNSQPRGNRVPRNRGYRNNRNDKDNERPRKYSGNQGNKSGNPERKRFIKRDQESNDRKFRRKPKGQHHHGGKDKKKAEDRDLDRQLRDYWIGQKGGTKEEDVKELGREKLNSEMDNYWKQKKEDEPNPAKTD